MLREWQASCVDQANKKYLSGQKHFLCLATPGAGKTTMAAELAARLFSKKMIDIVLCFAPSLTVANGIQKTFSNRLNCPFFSLIGNKGGVYTYQGMCHLDQSFWDSLKRFRVLVIFDEIHHCEGGDSANAWGDIIVRYIQDLATYTLALTGTPWRTNSAPIVLSRYTEPKGQICCDFSYGLHEAINDVVCRVPNIVLVDNESLVVSDPKGENQKYTSVAHYVEEGGMAYQLLITNQYLMEYILNLGCQKLNEIRRKNVSAGGLVVASSVQHAEQIAALLKARFKQSVTVVTYRHEHAHAEISQFRDDATQWIVSVGMVSEGTDIPRLQVCCHLSTIKTELHFRQVLGRILRSTSTEEQVAWLYTLAEPSLIEFAEQIAIDVPERYVVSLVQTDTDSTRQTSDIVIEGVEPANLGFNLNNSCTDILADLEINTLSSAEQTVSKLSVLGQFRDRLIRVF